MINKFKESDTLQIVHNKFFDADLYIYNNHIVRIEINGKLNNDVGTTSIDFPVTRVENYNNHQYYVSCICPVIGDYGAKPFNPTLSNFLSISVIPYSHQIRLQITTTQEFKDLFPDTNFLHVYPGHLFTPYTVYI